MNKQVKSRQRVADHGEVFTAEREVKAMCDLVLPETQRIDSRFLEPACGDGNFLAEVLSRKLAVVRKKYKRSTIDYEMNSLLAVSSLYGVDMPPAVSGYISCGQSSTSRCARANAVMICTVLSALYWSATLSAETLSCCAASMKTATIPMSLLSFRSGHSSQEQKFSGATIPLRSC